MLGAQTSRYVTPHTRRAEMLPHEFLRQSCGTPDATLSLLPNLCSRGFVSSTAALKSRRLEGCGEDLADLRVDSEWSE